MVSAGGVGEAHGHQQPHHTAAAFHLAATHQLTFALALPLRATRASNSLLVAAVPVQRHGVLGSHARRRTATHGMPCEANKRPCMVAGVRGSRAR